MADNALIGAILKSISGGIGGYLDAQRYNQQIMLQKLQELQQQKNWEDQFVYRKQRDTEQQDWRNRQAVDARFWRDILGAREAISKREAEERRYAHDKDMVRLRAGSAQTDDPPDLVGKFSDLVDKARTSFTSRESAWKKDPTNISWSDKGEEIVEPFTEPPPDPTAIFNARIRPMAGRYGLNEDSVYNVARIMFPDLPGLGVEIPDYSEEAGYMPGWGIRAQSPVGGGGRVQAIQSLIQEFGQGQWESASDQVREAAIKRRLAEMQ